MQSNYLYRYHAKCYGIVTNRNWGDRVAISSTRASKNDSVSKCGDGFIMNQRRLAIAHTSATGQKAARCRYCKEQLVVRSRPTCRLSRTAT